MSVCIWCSRSTMLNPMVAIANLTDCRCAHKNLHAHCVPVPLEWELIRRNDDNNVMGAEIERKKGKKMEQRLLLWPPCIARHKCCSSWLSTTLYATQHSTVDIYRWLNLSKNREKKWNEMLFSRNRSSNSRSFLVKRWNWLLFSLLSITSDVCWRRNIVTAPFRNRNRFSTVAYPF